MSLSLDPYPVIGSGAIVFHSDPLSFDPNLLSLLFYLYKLQLDPDPLLLDLLSLDLLSLDPELLSLDPELSESIAVAIGSRSVVVGYIVIGSVVI